MIERWSADLVKANVHFKPRGRDRAGIDCWGIVYLYYKEILNIDLPSYTDLYSASDIRNYEHLHSIFKTEVPLWQLVDIAIPADVVLLRLRGRPIHVGLVIEPGRMLHIEEGIDICEERYDGIKWKNRVIGVHRYKPQ